MFRTCLIHRCRIAVAALVGATLLGACASSRVTLDTPSRLASPADIDDALADPASGALRATAAWVSATGHLRIDYLGGGRSFSVSTVLPPDGPAQGHAAQAASSAAPPVVAYAPVPTHPAAPEGEAVAIRPPAAWQQLVQRLQREVAAQVPNRGVVLDVLRQHEFFLTVDAAGELNVVPIEDKAADIEPAGVVTLTELLTGAAERVGEGLRAEGETGRFLLFNTGDQPDTGFPFVLMDLHQRRVFFVQQQPDSALVEVHGPALAAQAAFHAITGQVKSLANRPVSSFARLLSSVGVTAVDTLWVPARLRQADAPVPPLADAPPMDKAAWEAELDAMQAGRATYGTVDFLVDGEAFFPALMHAIGQARESIRMRLYIFDNDDYAVKIADLLKARSRDVDVQILVDGFGTIAGGLGHAEYTPPGSPGGPASIVRYLQTDSNVDVRVIANPWLQGDHTKVIIIDDHSAFLGGMNIGREYRYEWHDLMARVSGPVVDVLIRDFVDVWTHEGPLGDLQALLHRASHPLRTPGPADQPLRLLYTRPMDSQILRAQVRAMRRARQRVWLQNAYLTSDAILHELTAARRRGVDVRVILPYRTDAGPINRSNVLAANHLLRNGVRVFIYPGMSHVKAAIYDDWACLGSANFDKLSLRLNKETNIATSYEDTVHRLVDAVFAPDFARAVELHEPLPAGWLDYLNELVADQL